MSVFGVDYAGDTACLCPDGLCEACSAVARRLLAAERLAKAVQEVVTLYDEVKYGRVNEHFVASSLRSALLAWKEAGK
jgi:hypothetical protein